MNRRTILMLLVTCGFVTCRFGFAQPAVEPSFDQEIAKLLRYQGYRKAAEACVKLLMADNKDALANEMLETVLERSALDDQIRNLEGVFRDWAERDPQKPLALYWLGAVLAAQVGREAEAEELYQRALQEDPRFPDAHRGLAILYHRRGDGRAEAEWEAFLKVESEGPRATAVRKGWVVISSRVIPGKRRFRCPSWSPDGKRFACVRAAGPDWRVSVRDADGDIKVLTEGMAGGFIDSFPDWSPDGRTIAFARSREEQGAATFGIDWAGDRRLFPLLPPISAVPQFSEDGRRLVADPYVDATLPVLEMQSRVRSLVGYQGVSENYWLRQPSWSPDSKRFVCTAFDWRRAERPIGMVNVQPGSRIRWIVDNGSYNAYPRFSPDGRSIVFASNEGGPEFHVWVMPAVEPFEPQRLACSGLRYHFVSDWSPDGRQLITECPQGWRLLTLGGLDTRSLKLAATWKEGGLTVLVTNRGRHALTVTLTYQLFDANSVGIEAGTIGKLEMPLQPEEVIEGPLALTAAKQPATYTVKLTAVTEKGERVVELVDYVVKG